MLLRRVPHSFEAAQWSRGLAGARAHASRLPMTSSVGRAAHSESSPAPSAAAPSRPPIGIVMLNMGGPSSLEGPVDGVKPFLQRLFQDGEIIQLGPLQKSLGQFIAQRRSPRIREQYSKIGGRSPIGEWTEYQGSRLAATLNAHAPSLGPFKHYTCFRYAPPLTEEVLQRMVDDGVTRAIAFSQYPHFSCTTTGSSLNHLWRETLRLRGPAANIAWSVLDRWPLQPTFLAAVARRIALGLARFPEAERDSVVIVFSAHSVPMLVVNRGDPYVKEVAASVGGIMEALRAGVDIGDGKTDGGPLPGGAPNLISGAKNPHILAWQSKVGFLPWMGPSTATVLEGLGRQRHRNVLVVPVAFTSDHIETLFEIDVEYKHLAEKAGIARFERAPSLNDEPLLVSAMAQLVTRHLVDGAASTPEYPLNCAGCVNPACRSVLNPAAPYAKARDGNAGCAVPPWPSDAERAAQAARKEANP